MQKILFTLLFILSIAVGQAPPNEHIQFTQNYKKIFQAEIQQAPFSILNHSYTSSDFYITFKTSIRPTDLKLSDITSSQFFETTALHQQTQLGFFGFSAINKQQLAFSKKQDVLYVLSVSEYTNEENESRFLIECTKIDKNINYYSIVSDRKFNSIELKKAENLCAYF